MVLHFSFEYDPLFQVINPIQKIVEKLAFIIDCL